MSIFDRLFGRKDKTKTPDQSPEQEGEHSESKQGPTVSLPEEISETIAQSPLSDILPKCRNLDAIRNYGKDMHLEGIPKDLPQEAKPFALGTNLGFGQVFSRDAGDFLIYLTAHDVSSQDFTPEQVYTAAMKNFYALAGEKLRWTPWKDVPSVFEVVLDQLHEASVSLDPRMIRSIADQQGIKRVAFAVPTANSFFFWEKDDPTVDIELIKKEAKERMDLSLARDRVSELAFWLNDDAGVAEPYFEMIPQPKRAFDPNLTVSLGQCLVASSQLDTTPSLSRTVILLFKADEGGFAGFILNRPREIDLSTLIKGVPEDQFTASDGGPVQNDKALFIHTKGAEIGDDQEILPGLHALGDTKKLQVLMQSKSLTATDLRFFRGYAAWAKDQLLAEITEGAWSVVDLTVDEIMSRDATSLYERYTSSES